VVREKYEREDTVSLAKAELSVHREKLLSNALPVFGAR